MAFNRNGLYLDQLAHSTFGFELVHWNWWRWYCYFWLVWIRWYCYFWLVWISTLKLMTVILLLLTCLN